MKKYAKIINENTGMVRVGIGNDVDFYKSIGMKLMDVEKGTDGNWYIAGKVPEPTLTAKDYDNAMEEYIKAVCFSRGYTTREPSEYKDSSVPRWSQDAVDFIAFRDACMLYGLKVQNDYVNGKEVPTLEEFKANLPKCEWTYTETEDVNGL